MIVTAEWANDEVAKSPLRILKTLIKAVLTTPHGVLEMVSYGTDKDKILINWQVSN